MQKTFTYKKMSLYRTCAVSHNFLLYLKRNENENIEVKTAIQPVIQIQFFSGSGLYFFPESGSANQLPDRIRIFGISRHKKKESNLDLGKKPERKSRGTDYIYGTMTFFCGTKFFAFFLTFHLHLTVYLLFSRIRNTVSSTMIVFSTKLFAFL